MEAGVRADDYTDIWCLEKQQETTMGPKCCSDSSVHSQATVGQEHQCSE